MVQKMISHQIPIESRGCYFSETLIFLQNDF